ncbi:hypothetical protein G6011_09890 [Alternaria panax]|uniref:Uncharacterized protein n=1 Tax=Alternaria panax TaxID=48097 RepID=A0AAD4FBM8_9PLEO|nr:hypothetical protein G6011_09890 [Alternaria panax]
MGPFRKGSGLDVVIASSILANSNSSAIPIINTQPSSYPNTNTTHSSSPSTSESESESDIPILPPPAYHTIISANMPIPHISSPYDPLSQEDPDPNNHETSDTDTPEITINAATQIRGHGNIISIAQMDSVRVANLISTILIGENTTSPSTTPCLCNKNITPTTTTPPRSPTPLTPATQEHTSTTRVQGIKRFSNINITVNCGATIIGDRNIVGPGLGDIARQMQIAQRNQAAVLAQQAQQAQQRAAAMGRGVGTGGTASPPLHQGVTGKTVGGMNGMGGLGGIGGVAVATPPMSRSSSLNSEGGGGRKRRAGGDEVEGVGVAAQKRRC